MERNSVDAPRQLSLNVLLYQEGDYWVAKCVELDIITSGVDAEQVWKDSQDMCLAQVLYSWKTDPTFQHLFRPATSELIRLMAMARCEAMLKLQVNSSVVECELPEIWARRLAA